MRNAIRSILYSYASLLMPHCPVTVVQRYRDGVCSLLFYLFFIICHPYIPLHLEIILPCFITQWQWLVWRRRGLWCRKMLAQFKSALQLPFLMLTVPYNCLLISSSPQLAEEQVCKNSVLVIMGLCWIIFSHREHLRLFVSFCDSAISVMSDSAVCEYQYCE